MRHLIAGGAGFIGVHLTRRLLGRGDEVVIVDNGLTGWPTERVSAFCGDGVKHVYRDVQEDERTLIEDLPPIARREGIDVVWNLACPASPIHYQRDRVYTLRTSVLGTFNLLNVAVFYGARFVQASTSEVYGDPEVHPQTEEYCGNVNPVGPRACYDEGKRAAETLCFDYMRDRNLDVRVPRIFNTYGPMMHSRDGRLVSNFVTQALSGGPITVYGDGSQTRSLCYVDDLVDGLVRLLEVDWKYGPVNLGNPDEYAVGELANIVSEMFGGVSIAYCSLPQDDPRQRRPDISRARTLLGWEPRVSLSEGLSKTVDFFRAELTDA